MAWLVGFILWAGPPDACGDVPLPADSYLYRPAYCVDRRLRGPAWPYLPQPGDLMFATDDNLFWAVAHNLAGTSHPHHSGVVFARPDGSLAVLEAGPYDTLYVRTLDLLPHLRCYEQMGPVWIRRRTVPLTREELARLTAFALAQDGKRFALVRLGGQLTPLRSRGPLRIHVLGKSKGNRRAYFCSELMMEALVAAGLLDPAVARPAATYPRDIFLDRSPNPYLNRTLKLAPCWEPPARWSSCGTAANGR